MAVIVLASASGSPGVTTTSVGLALTWPRPVLLVEADPTGGSGVLAGFFRGLTEPAATLIDLVVAHRQGHPVEQVLPALVMGLPGADGVQLLPGVLAHTQARSLPPVWEPLAGALRGLDATGTDVLVDAGRLGLAGWPEPLIVGADLTLLVCRRNLPAVAAARSWAHVLGQQANQSGTRVGCLLVGDGQPYSPREVAKALALPAVATLGWDPDTAAVFSRGAPRPRRFDDAPLVRGLHAAGSAIRATLNPRIDQTPMATSGRGRA